MSKRRSNASIVMDGLLRLVIFGIGYIVITCLCLFIIICAIAAITGLVNVIPYFDNGVAIAVILIVIIALTLFVAVSIANMIKPWVTFRRRNKIDLVEVTRNECPKLFDVLESLSRETKVRMPHHVYLDVSANACAVFRAAFGFVSFRRMDSLLIGLRAFKYMKVGEAKAMLAHEFGHNGMKSLAAIEIAEGKILKLMNSDDCIDRIIARWRSASSMPLRLLCVVACLLRAWANRCICQFSPLIMQGLSRVSCAREFEADAIACHCVGSKMCISSVCKVQHFACCYENHLLMTLLNNMLNDGNVPEDYFSAYDMIVSEMRKKGWCTIEVTDTLTEAFHPFFKAESRIKVNVEDPWRTLPDLQERIELASSLSISRDAEEQESAWNLIPDEITKKVSDRLFEKIAVESGRKLEVISTAELKGRVEKMFAEQVFPGKISEFFDRSFERFELEKAFETSIIENPFTAEYRSEIAKLNTARADMVVLNNFRDGMIKSPTLSYDGVEYRRKDVPIDIHQKYLDGLIASVREKDSAMCSYLCHIGSEVDCSRARDLYETLARLEEICGNMDGRLKDHDEYINKCFASGKTIKGQRYKELCLRIVAVEKALQQGIIAVKESIPDVIEQNEWGERLINYTTDQHNFGFEYGPRSFAELQNYRKMFAEMCRKYHRHCRFCLAQIADAYR